jgi:two-component system sensor histidine kinase/response regulator
MFTFLRNITRRKALEKEISFKNTILQAQLDTSLDGILIVDNSGKTLLYNIRFGSMWKIPRKLLDFKDDDTMLRHVLSQLKDPDGFVSKVESLYKVKNARSKDLIEFKDGRFFERYSSPLKDASGQYFGRIWYFHDVTELKKDEESIKLSEEKFKLLYESSRDAIMQLDPKKGFIGGNAATIKMFKCRSESEFIKRGPADLSPKRQEDGTLSTVKAQKMIRIAMEKGSNFFDWTHKRMDGNVFPATVLLTRMQLKGKIFLQATVRDVSESKKTETKLKISELSLREENVILEEENLALKRVLVNFKKGNKRVPKTAAKKDQK